MEANTQTDKRPISEKQRAALTKGREKHHADARAYKEMLLSKASEPKAVEEIVEVKEAVPEVKKLYNISFM